MLGVDTCGPSGSVVLARLEDGRHQIVGEVELAGKTYSATLVMAVSDLLSRVEAKPVHIRAIAVTHGPGSFTGVRVGLSAVKGLAEPGGIPVVAISRLEVLAKKAGTESAALDAHRHELFVRVPWAGGKVREFLGGRAELESLDPIPARLAVCDDAAELLAAVWPRAELARVVAPTAADVIEAALPKILAQDFADPALLDGHYLRRSDAEIFGKPAHVTVRPT